MWVSDGRSNMALTLHWASQSKRNKIFSSLYNESPEWVNKVFWRIHGQVQVQTQGVGCGSRHPRSHRKGVYIREKRVETFRRLSLSKTCSIFPKITHEAWPKTIFGILIPTPPQKEPTLRRTSESRQGRSSHTGTKRLKPLCPSTVPLSLRG